jgi:dihydrolipoamide dehydrogenase
MATKVIMPKLGLTMVEGKIIRWLKKEGDVVKKDEPLLEVESDKSTFAVEAPVDGVLRAILAEQDVVPCGETIAVIAGTDENISALLGGGQKTSVKKEMLSTPVKSSDADYDISVIGGGPGGYVAAIKASQLGARVVLFEKDALGGVCLNRGCIPTKTLLKSVKALKQLKKFQGFAIDGIDHQNAKVNFSKLNKRKEDVIRHLTTGVAGLLKANGVTVVNGNAQMNEQGIVEANGLTYRAKNVIIATGSKPKLIPIPGIDSPYVITSEQALFLEKVPEQVVILGGGVIGIEFAFIFRELGAEVAVVEMMDRILPAIDEEVALVISNVMKSSGINIYTSSKAKAIKGNTLVFEKDGKEYELNGDKILVSVGKAPCFDGIDVDKLGIKTEKGAIVTDASLRTSVPGIYAIGDVNGKHMLAHTASAEGIIAVKNILGKQSRMDYSTVPQCVYSLPEIASVGLTERQARKLHGNIIVAKFPFSANGKALIEDETTGFVKVIASERYKEILGVHIVGPDAPNMISEAVLAMKLECTADELSEIIHPHPAISECLQEAFYAAAFKPIHYF